jgi:tetratricopeptide (TPR) repeat protein
MSFLERRWPLLLAFIFLVGLAFRLGYLYQASRTPFFRPLTLDSEAYEAKAAEILSSPGFLPRGVFYQTPFYPYLLAFLHKIFGRTLLPIRLLQVLLGASLPVLVFLISRRYFPVSASLLAALFSAFYGPLLYEDALGDKTTLAAFFFALAALASAKAAGNQKGWLLAGFSWGVGALVRENFLLVGVVLSLIYGRKKAWLALLGILLAVLPVTLMNLRAGDFALVTSQGGQNFYIGNNPQATGGYAAPSFVRATPEFEQVDFKKEAEARVGRTLKPSEASGFWLREGLKFIFSNPGSAALLYVKKALLVVNAYEIPDNYNYGFLKRYLPLLRFPLFEFGLIGPLALCGLFYSWRRGRERKVSLLYVAISLYALTLVLFFVVGRYRAPVVPLLFPFAAFAITHLVEEVSKRKWKGLAVMTAVLVIFGILVNHRRADYPISKDFSREHYMLGSAFRKAGLLPDAVREWEQALAERPDYKEALNNLALAKNIMREDSLRQAVLSSPSDAGVHLEYGVVLLDLQKDSLALAEFQQAIRLNPSLARAWDRLGFYYATRERNFALAKEALTKAVALEPGNPTYWTNLGNCHFESGDKKSALACWRRALALRPEDSVLRNNISALQRD